VYPNGTETGMSPAKAVENLRLEAARLMLEQGRLPVQTIARANGFADREIKRVPLRNHHRPWLPDLFGMGVWDRKEVTPPESSRPSISSPSHP
jgi:hypothetical protein